jgi:hypothetical protein
MVYLRWIALRTLDSFGQVLDYRLPGSVPVSGPDSGQGSGPGSVTGSGPDSVPGSGQFLLRSFAAGEAFGNLHSGEAPWVRVINAGQRLAGAPACVLA